MSIRVRVEPLQEADAYAVWDARADVHLILISELLNPGQQLALGAHLADRLRRAVPDAGIHIRPGETTAMAPTIAPRELVDLMDQRELSIDGFEAVLNSIFELYPEEPDSWLTSGLAP